MQNAPVDGAQQTIGGGAERFHENAHDMDIGGRRLLLQRRGDGGTVADAIRKILRFAFRSNRDAARDAANVRVGEVNTAIDDGDADLARRGGAGHGA